MRILPYPATGAGSSLPESAPGSEDMGKGVIEGGVIMSKLANETAKCVGSPCSSLDL